MLVVTDPGLRRLGLVDTVLEGAEREGLGVTVYDQVLYHGVMGRRFPDGGLLRYIK